MKPGLTDQSRQLVGSISNSIDRATFANLAQGLAPDGSHKLISIVTKGPRKGEVCLTKGSDTERVPGELVAVKVRHSTSRPTDEQIERGTPPDVHLHSHAFLLNMAWVPDESHKDGGKWRAIDDHNIKKLRQTLEHATQGEFARLLEERLGAKIDYSTDQSGTTRWRLAGIDPRSCEFFSTRSREIEAEKRAFEQRAGRPPTPAELRDLAREHRRPKDSEWNHDRAPQWDAYAEGLRAAGLAVPRFKTQVAEAKTLEEREAELRKRLLRAGGLCNDDALFYRETISPTVVRCAVGLGLSPAEIADFTRRFEAGPDLTLERKVGENPSRLDLLSTRAVKAREAFIVEAAIAKATNEAPAPTAETVRAAIASSPVRLDAEQVRAVEAACAPNGWTVWNGWAGTGKSTALRAVVDAYTGAGGRPAVADHVFALSTAAMTAQETARKIGAEEGYTIEGLTIAADKGRLRLTERSVLIVDEYVMLDTFRAAELLRVAGGAQIICVGDPRQLQGIGASGWQADVEEALRRRGQVPVELTNVHRQVDAADREMLAAQRSGDAAEALANLAERGRFHVAATPEQADGEVIAAYKRFRDQGRSVNDLFVNTDTSNARVDTYNRLIQDDRLARGEIGGRHLDYRSTNAGRHETLYEGDRVALVRGVEDRGTRIANGRKGTIVRIDEEHRRAIVRLDDGKAVRVDIALSDPMVPLRLAYAGHATRTQGSEAPVVLVVPGNANTTLESAYSSLSRGQEEIHVFADTTTHGFDPLSHLAKRWARPEPKRTATARAADLRGRATISSPAAVVPPAGGGPMTGRQAHYLATLAARAGEEASASLTRLEATERITELQQRIGRSPPPWARSLAGELAALREVSPQPEENAQAVAARLAEARTEPRTGTEGSEPIAARLAGARSRLRDPSEVSDALDVSATDAIEALAEAGRLAEQAALHPEPPSFEPAPIEFEPPPIDFRPEGREAEAGRERSRQRSRERHRPGPGPGMGR